jgi:hypothetical protein
MKAKLAFYKGPGNIVDRAIRLWTRSKYSHVELVIEDMWYSTSPREMEVKARRILAKEANWDYVEVDVDELSVASLYAATKGAKYDWTGIVLSQFLPLDIHSRKRFFCSEWCAEALNLADSNKYSPEDLYKYALSPSGSDKVN